MTTCFLCGKEIEGKKSREHILGDSFLQLLDIKIERFKFNSSSEDKEYSRLKVPSHPKCNNGFGSRFESDIINLISSFDEKREFLNSLHLNDVRGEVDRLRGALTKWLAKLYLGFVYWEVGLPRHPNVEFQTQLSELLTDPILDLLQRVLNKETPLFVPSSLFYFKIPEYDDVELRFDFATGLPLGLFFIKFQGHLLVVALGDGNLVSEYFTNEQYLYSQYIIDEHKDNDPLAYLHPVSHIWAVRELLPVQPKLKFFNGYISNESRVKHRNRPDINGKAVNSRATEIFTEHASRFGAEFRNTAEYRDTQP
ncbi:hypothetical protein SAMN05421840_102164 [Shewanella morhuae]|uniref:hypothetical protein n=1 Tax=Shewanella morhuae TaxID=365591 RepID=UPI0009563E43|nr:hypothetical protein [Shewanella morhuae]SIQ56861.1 hypothetical protein SAMN05421840_102164 [Shewanella morhuae]